MTNPFQPEQTASESPIQPDTDAGQALLNTMLTRTASATMRILCGSISLN